MQIQGMTQKAEPIAHALLGGPLALRNDAAIRYRMRNVSAVAKELGAPTLYGFSPAESVGTNVRSRIRDMLQQHVDFDRILHPAPRSPAQDRADALAVLAVLRERIGSLESEFAWLGHNQPPEATSPEGLSRQELREAQSSISNLEAELAKPEFDDAKVQEGRSRLMKFVVALAGWLGARATKFVDAALKVAAPIVVIKVTGLMPHAVSAVEAIARVLGR
jgi:hypothetical protein